MHWHACNGQIGVVLVSPSLPDEVALLRQTALAQEFRRAQNEIRYKGRAVFQDFDVCFPAPRTGAFDKVATQLETGIFRRQSICQTCPR